MNAAVRQDNRSDAGSGLTCRLLDKTPENLSRLWSAFFRKRELFPEGFVDDVASFRDLFSDDGTVVFELGEMEGAVYFTEIVLPAEAGPGESKASVHIFVWSERYLGQSQFLRAIVALFMDKTGLHRVFAEMPADNLLAIRAAEAAGFNCVGRLRKRARMKSGWSDTYLYDLLKEDLMDQVRAQPLVPAVRG